MRWRGVHHVEFAVLDYDDSIAFYDAMFGWLGYLSFWTLDIDYRSTYYMTRYPSAAPPLLFVHGGCQGRRGCDVGLIDERGPAPAR
jgi:catechol 2,3-dioxygenase-like lactoylglutathione lyase family enzyme